MTTSKDFIKNITKYLENGGAFAADIMFDRNYEIFMDFVTSCNQAFDLPDEDDAKKYDYYEVVNWSASLDHAIGHEVRVAMRFAKVVYSHK